jgi:cellulose synthase/poly-beta-1,6-N-acetylglucosamine synthase-like glycosyltransferase
MPLTPWSPWNLWLTPPLEGALPPTGWTQSLLFVVLFCALVDFVKLLVELLGRSEERRFTSDPALVTAVIPSRNGARELPATIGELRRFLPPERILVVDDASTDDTGRVAAALGCEVHRFDRCKGKAAAVHYAVYRVRTPYTLLLDDDTRLGGARIPTSLLSEDGYDAVAFHVLPDRRNREGARGNNFLGALQRYEYGKSMEIGKRFHDVTHSVACVSGAVGLFRTADLNRLHHRHTGVFQAEDLQRTIIHLLERNRIVFANEPVWTVAPAALRQWLKQRLTGWYPGLYHQLANFIRLLFRNGVSWRLRYEMVYNLYMVVSDPLKTWSIVVIALTPTLWWWGLVLYLTYLAFEVYPYAVVRIPEDRRRAPVMVLLLYPIYGVVNTVLRTASIATWFWFRYVTGTMRPRRGPKDRIA